MELLFKNQVLGEVKNITADDFPWLLGDFVPGENYYLYKEFLDFLVDEEATEEPNFDEELYKDNNWFIKDENCIRGIIIPAIYEDGTIALQLS